MSNVSTVSTASPSKTLLRFLRLGYIPDFRMDVTGQRSIYLLSNTLDLDKKGKLTVVGEDGEIKEKFTNRESSVSVSSTSTLYGKMIQISLSSYIDATCPHITKPFFVRPLIMPHEAIQDHAGLKGWFTHLPTPDLKWER